MFATASLSRIIDVVLSKLRMGTDLFYLVGRIIRECKLSLMLVSTFSQITETDRFQEP